MQGVAATLTDAQLVARCRTGDVDAWRELVERFSRYVYAICTRGFRLPEEDAEDVFQEVFARVYGSLHTLRDDAAIRPWIGQLTRRLCIDTLAKRARERPEAEPVLEEPTQNLAEIEEAFELHDAVASLSGTCQDMLDRFFTRDQSYRTISAELNLPPGTIASRISRCLAKLRHEFTGKKAAPPTVQETVIE